MKVSTNGYYKISSRIGELEDKIAIIDNKAKNITDSAKRLPKGSEERKSLMNEAKVLKESEEYKGMKIELKTLYFCLNSIFYN